MEITPTYIPIIASASAALIVGSVTFIVSMLSKEQKTSEFRQNWIEGLRADISDYLAHVEGVFKTLRFRKRIGHGKSDLEEYLLSKEGDVNSVNAILYRICLRLNPKEHERLINLLKTIGNVAGIEDKDNDTFNKNLELAIKEAQAVLKIEWQRVKSGEIIFRFTKWGSCVIFFLAAILLLVKIYGS